MLEVAQTVFESAFLIAGQCLIDVYGKQNMCRYQPKYFDTFTREPLSELRSQVERFLIAQQYPLNSLFGAHRPGHRAISIVHNLVWSVPVVPYRDVVPAGL